MKQTEAKLRLRGVGSGYFEAGKRRVYTFQGHLNFNLVKLGLNRKDFEIPRFFSNLINFYQLLHPSSDSIHGFHPWITFCQGAGQKESSEPLQLCISCTRPGAQDGPIFCYSKNQGGSAFYPTMPLRFLHCLFGMVRTIGKMMSWGLEPKS